MRLDDPARNEAVVSVDDGEGAGANELCELADRRQARAGGELAVLDQLRDALGDLVDQRDCGFAGQLEHDRGLKHHRDTRGHQCQRSTMLNVSRPAGVARKPRSELPNRAQTAMHGRLITAMIADHVGACREQSQLARQEHGGGRQGHHPGLGVQKLEYGRFQGREWLAALRDCVSPERRIRHPR